jgi:hypothetical protein
VGAEAVVRLAFDRISRIQRRTADEHRAAVTASRSGTGRRLLVVGNSLLDEGVQFDALKDRLAPNWDARRFVVEQTFYTDWYYGLRRLFKEGARPDAVIMVLTPGQWTRDEIRGDYSAQYLMTRGDAARATLALHMHPTRATSFLLASESKFWGARAEIRNFLLGRVMPDLVTLMNISTVGGSSQIDDETIEQAAAPHLERCRRLAAAYGAVIVALVPPVLQPHDGAAALVRAGERAGVEVLVPVTSGRYPAAYYRDAGFHLNATGAHAFTTTLGSTLPEALSTIAARTATR